MRVGDDVWLDARCTSERAARESVGRECGCARAGAGADIYSKCQGCNCASAVRVRTRKRDRSARDNGGRRRGGIVILSRMASIYPRHASSIEKPACLNVPVSPRPRKRLQRGFIVCWWTINRIYRIVSKKGFFFCHKSSRCWKLIDQVGAFFFNSKCHQVWIAFESLIRFVVGL